MFEYCRTVCPSEYEKLAGGPHLGHERLEIGEK